MNIRKATIEDIDILIKLRIEYLIADRGGLTAEEKAAIQTQLITYFSKNINNSFIAVFAEKDDCVVSTAFLAISEKPANPSFITGKTGTILNVLTYPKYRRQGLATKVLNALIDEARQLGLSSIDLSASSEGKPLYQKLGFTETKTKYTPMKLQLV
ncbi:MAG: GCN5-like N-acetyltransferase [Eubacterium sp.]|jgi:ribosomal protein S18 acetylase RimI-like enzyme|nr:GCN5-like N-acetyltransferase [Eubacterium sp.]